MLSECISERVGLSGEGSRAGVYNSWMVFGLIFSNIFMAKYSYAWLCVLYIVKLYDTQCAIKKCPFWLHSISYPFQLCTPPQTVFGFLKAERAESAAFAQAIQLERSITSGIDVSIKTLFSTL